MVQRSVFPSASEIAERQDMMAILPAGHQSRATIVVGLCSDRQVSPLRQKNRATRIFSPDGIAGIKNSAYLCTRIGGLAQLARALAWHARGHRFESDILHHKNRLHTHTGAIFEENHPERRFSFFVKNRAFQSLFVRLFGDSLSKHTASTEKNRERTGCRRANRPKRIVLPTQDLSGQTATAPPMGRTSANRYDMRVRTATPDAPRRRCPYPYRWIAAPRCGWKSPAACPRQAGRFCPAARSSRRRGKPSPPAYFRAA